MTAKRIQRLILALLHSRLGLSDLYTAFYVANCASIKGVIVTGWQ